MLWPTTRVSILNLADDVIKSLKPLAAKKKIKLFVTDNDSIPSVQADKDQMKQVLINLIDNAIHYSKPDQAVVVQLRVVNRKACIQVVDRGVGISLVDQVRVFERFYRVDEARSRGGTGLGLAIVKSLVDGMGGELSLQSKLGEGSTFSVFLPAVDVRSQMDEF